MTTVETQNVESTLPFYPVLPDFQKSTAFWNVPKLCPFVLLVRATCRWRWVWNIAEVLGEKPVPMPLFPSHILHGYLRSNTSLHSERLATNWLIERLGWTWNIPKGSARQSKIFLFSCSLSEKIKIKIQRTTILSMIQDGMKLGPLH